MAINKQQNPNQPPSRAPLHSSRAGGIPWKPAQEAMNDIESSFGFIPEFMNTVTDQALVGAWNEVKNLYFNPHTSLDPKLKSLIGLAIGTQIPCDMLTYFDHQTSTAAGATAQEQAEAVLLGSMTRHWSTVIHGNMIDKNEFKKETDKIITHVQKMMKESGGKAPPEEGFLTYLATAAETYKDIEKTLGLVPKFFLSFPESGIAAAWSEFKAFQLNPHTALNGKQKELIGLAVSAQIPCEFCIYFHHTAAKLNGANDKELQEAVAIASLSRKWSALFHGSSITLERFKQNTDRMVENMGKGNLPL